MTIYAEPGKYRRVPPGIGLQKYPFLQARQKSLMHRRKPAELKAGAWGVGYGVPIQWTLCVFMSP